MIPVAAPKFELVGVADQIARQAYAKIQASQFRQKSVCVVATGEKRSAQKNAMIAAVQAKHGRDPFYISKDAMPQLKLLARGVLSRDRGMASGALVQIGNLLLRTVKSNIGAQVSRGGRTFKELTKKYAAYKQKKFGFTKPILRASGELMDNLAIRIEE